MLIDWCLAPTVAVFQLRNHGGRRCLLSTEGTNVNIYIFKKVTVKIWKRLKTSA